MVAIVAQSSAAVRRYVEENGLPFNILIDESREVLKAYGVWHRVGLDAWNISRPALFLIDREGHIVARYGPRQTPDRIEGRIMEVLETDGGRGFSPGDRRP